jgi:acetaldehyde dehydrogenase (acetylating)
VEAATAAAKSQAVATCGGATALARMAVAAARVARPEHAEVRRELNSVVVGPGHAKVEFAPQHSGENVPAALGYQHIFRQLLREAQW